MLRVRATLAVGVHSELACDGAGRIRPVWRFLWVSVRAASKQAAQVRTLMPRRAVTVESRLGADLFPRSDLLAADYFDIVSLEDPVSFCDMRRID